MLESVSDSGSHDVIPVKLDDGTQIFVEARTPIGEQNVSGKLDVTQGFDQVANGIGKISSTLLDAIKSVAPSDVELEFGVDLNVQSNGLFALLVKGGTTGSIKVTVKWSHAAGS